MAVHRLHWIQNSGHRWTAAAAAAASNGSGLQSAGRIPCIAPFCSLFPAPFDLAVQSGWPGCLERSFWSLLPEAGS